MKLFPPQDPLNLYNEGFGQNDLLDRKLAGARLSELLEKVDDCVVIAVDGSWGSGKSHFLKRWVGAHKIENGGTGTTVYFDAFAHDYLDDPLIALTGAIGDRLSSEKENKKWEIAKKVATKLARPIFRIGAAMATAGASEYAVPVIDAALGAGEKELEKAAEQFWKREDGRKAAMKQFQGSLGELTKSSDEDATGKPLIVVIDELDRCRPDYALAVLEVIKHFFAVPRVHFVLGVNLDALEHMVRVRYGAGINATDYLKRFVSVSMRLPEKTGGQGAARAEVKYFRHAASKMGIDDKLVDIVADQLGMAVEPAGISLRDIERMLTRLVLLPRRKEIPNYYYGYQFIVVTLVIWQVVRPDLFRAVMRRDLTINEVDAFFSILPKQLDRASRSDSYNHKAYLLHGLWLYSLTGAAEPDTENFAKEFDTLGSRGHERILENIERDFFGLFEIAE